MRECIKPEEMCCFASGESFRSRSLEYQFRISRKAISYIVEQVVAAIIKILGETYLKTPNTTDEWVKISRKFKECWNFPNGLGGVDGKRTVLQQPKSSGWHYRNFKGTDSIILLAMVGPEYEFLFVDVGMNGRNCDGGNWSQSRLKNGLEIKPYMMKHYPQKNLSLQKRIFNYRLPRMRRISQNAFGILANRWRVFRKPFLLEAKKVKGITLALLTLHNWLIKESDIGKVYFSPTFVDREDPETGEIIEGFWGKEIPTESWKSFSNTRTHNPANEAKRIREEFTDYFINEDCIPWQ